MKLSQSGLRKAAILVSSLDTGAADTLLEQLTPEQARQVRQFVMDLDRIDGGEQDRVIDEFMRVGPLIPAKAPPGIELDGRLAWLGMQQGASPEDRAERPHDAARPFRFLQDAEADKLARVLADERPQTIALVLSHMPHARAGAVLSRLAADLQVEVIHRLMDLEETDPEILHEVETALQARLSEQVEMQRRRVAGIQAVAGILEATEGGVGMEILDNLAARDRSLAERLGPRPIEFDDLDDLDDDVLGDLFDTVGRQLLIPALLGAAPRFVDRVLSQFPVAEGDAIRQQLNSPGPIRLRDVEEARRQVAQIARRMIYRSRKQSANRG
jgi:flagellar motor switch protein FliG